MGDITELFRQRDGESQMDVLERARSGLHVYMTHTTKDAEYLPVLSYRVNQEIQAAESRLEALRELQNRVNTERVVKSVIG